MTGGECNPMSIKEWPPQSPEFKVETEILGYKFEAHTKWVGADDITEPKYVRIEGVDMDVNYDKTRSMSGGTWGIEVGYYRACEFDCRYDSFLPDDAA